MSIAVKRLALATQAAFWLALLWREPPVGGCQWVAAGLLIVFAVGMLATAAAPRAWWLEP